MTHEISWYQNRKQSVWCHFHDMSRRSSTVGKLPLQAPTALNGACLTPFPVYMGSSGRKTYHTVIVWQCTHCSCEKIVFSRNVLTGKKMRNCTGSFLAFSIVNVDIGWYQWDSTVLVSTNQLRFWRLGSRCITMLWYIGWLHSCDFCGFHARVLPEGTTCNSLVYFMRNVIIPCRIATSCKQVLLCVM